MKKISEISLIFFLTFYGEYIRIGDTFGGFVMKFKLAKNVLGIVPIILILLFWFIYSYGSVNPDTSIGILVSSIVEGYKQNKKAFSSFLTINNNQAYLESVSLFEEEDTARIEKEKAELELMNAKKGIADLSNWNLPIVGNYTITTYYKTGHRAIDYYSYEGYDSDILAANNGTVYTVKLGCVAGNMTCNGGRGNYIVINHNNGNYYTMYMHLNKSYVNVGDTVLAGERIASMGNTGHVIPAPTSSNPYGGTHLHFEVFIGIPDRGGYKINPLSLY